MFVCQCVSESSGFGGFLGGVYESVCVFLCLGFSVCSHGSHVCSSNSLQLLASPCPRGLMPRPQPHCTKHECLQELAPRAAAGRGSP